jgi:outer membrane protein assembly factor BamB
MRLAVKTILAVAIVTGALILIAIMITGRCRPAESKKPVAVPRPQLPLADNGSWPMFHCTQNLAGRAEGTLPDSMVLIWKFKTGGEVKSSPAIRLAGKPTIENGLVFAGSADANVYAIDLKNGRQVWAYKTGDAVEAAPCVPGDSVFIGSSDDFLYALDAKTGQLKWKYQTGGKIMGAANWTPSPDGHTIWLLVGSYDNKLHCVDSATGKAVWTYETGSYVNGSPAVGEGKVIFGGCDAMIHVVSVADGKMLTQIDTGSYIAGSAAIVGGRVYVGNYDNVLLCGDIASSKVLWKYTGGTSPIFSSPAVSEGAVVFGCRDKRVHCVSSDNGKPVWTFQTSGEVDSSPAICGDKVVVGSSDGRLYMIRLSDGKQVWSYEVGQPITSSPAVAGGMVVVGSDDGFIYAFGPSR